MPRRQRSRRVRVTRDWVMTPQGYAPFADAFGLTSGDGVIGIPLTICDKARILLAGNQVDTLAELRRMSWAAVPEGNNDSVHAVRGQFQWTTQAQWIQSDYVLFAMRLAIHEQDVTTLAPITSLGYALGTNTLVTTDGAFNSADERFMWERKVYARQSDFQSQPGRILDINWSGRRTLKPDQALFLMVEVADNGQNIFFSPWLRTLMTAGAQG